MITSPWRLLSYVAVILFGALICVPNLLTDEQLSRLPSWLPKEQVTLGLDLRGGSHLVLEVDAKALTKERLQNLTNDVRHELLQMKSPASTVRREGDALVVTVAAGSDRTAILQGLRKLVTVVGPAARAAPDIAMLPEGPANIRITLTEEGLHDRMGAAVEQSLEIVRQRIDQVGVAEPTIQRVGGDRILVQLPGVQDPARIKTLLGSTAKLTFHLVDTQGGHRPGFVTMPGTHPGESYVIDEKPVLGGDRLSDARVGFDPQTHQPVVAMRFDRAGGAIFGAMTQANVGKPFAILLDGHVLTAPVIQGPIMGGQGQITGNFTVQSATDLSALLRAGALPVPLTVIEERTVGADLGSDAIKLGVESGLAGFGLVFAFMFALYGRWALIANLALALNVILTFSALTILGATLTLPGIAGIVLGIGLAVDANVLINERIREETRKGLSAYAALNAGFKRAYATIVDSNVTGLIATVLLYMFGSGPVRGFAVTMALGIAISMFTAVAVVRVIMNEIVRRRRLKTIRIEPPFGALIPEGTKIPFMRGRFVGIGLSIMLSLASIALFISPGLNYGVDFKGGIQLEVATAGPVDMAAFRSGLDSLGIGEIALQQFGGPSDVLIRAERQAGGEEAQTAALKTIQAKLLEMNPTAEIKRTEVVGPKVSGELAVAGVLSVVLASVAMLIYIWVRFEWHFAVGAIVTLILDVTKTVGFFALTGIDFNLTAIAALLTLVGYSVNDKVVVYDRIRESLRLYKRMPLREIIDRSINETLGRSLYTSITAFLAMVPMAIWGGSAVESFAVPMVFGIVIAASSSVFIAAPILMFLGDWRTRRAQAVKTPEADGNALPAPAVVARES